MSDAIGWRFVKLIRDGISRYWVPPGEYVYTRMNDPEEGVKRLRQKLVGDAAEYAVEPSLDELADVYEVIQALALRDLGLTMVEVGEAARRKYQERGGFEDLTAMYVRTTGPDGHPLGADVRPAGE